MSESPEDELARFGRLLDENRMPVTGKGGTMQPEGVCEHVWLANSGRGGEPDFRLNRMMWFGEKMHVLCEVCGCRTWLSPEEWLAHCVPGADT